ncbi:MAG: fibronectin type III domain-containing protein [Thermoplasmatota archaeon]
MSRKRIGRVMIVTAFFILLDLSYVESDHGTFGNAIETGIGRTECIVPSFDSFIENRGQLHRDDILFYTSGPARIGLAADRTLFVVNGTAKKSLSYEIRYTGCNPTIPTGIGSCSGVYNYLIGDREDWRTDVPHYSEVYYRDLWDGIDLVYRISEGLLKYDLIIHPDSSPDDIRMEYVGIDELNIQGNGDLIIETPMGPIWDRDLAAYQNGDEIPVKFSISDGNSVSFDVGRYDKEDALIIDPFLEFSTYFPESRTEIVLEDSVAHTDDIYIAGVTDSVEFPTTTGVFDATVEKYESFVCRMKPDLSGFVFSTLIGGSGVDKLEDMVVDDNGNIYIGGLTDSLDYPTTAGALNETSNIWTDPQTSDPYDDVTFWDAFMTKLNSDGTDLIYSTYLGGHNVETVKDLDVDSSGNLYASGYVGSTDFPLKNPYQDTLMGRRDFFILKLNPQGSELIYSTLFGFNETWGWEQDYDDIMDIAVDDIGRVVFCGITDDEEFPVTTGVYNSDYVNDMGYLAMLYPNGSGLEFCTFICESMVPYDTVIDGFDRILIGGVMIADSLDYTSNAVDKSFNGQLEGFIASMDFNGTTLNYATYFGGDDIDLVHEIDIDQSDNIWITGSTESADLHVTDDAYSDVLSGRSDAYASCISGDGSNVIFSTYFGGSEGDSAQDIIILNMNEFYISGSTYSLDLPATQEAMFQNFTGTSYSTFISKIKVNSNIPSAPGNPFVIEGDRFVNVSWVKPAITGNEDILNFSVYRSLDGVSFEITAVVDAEIRWFNDTGLENGITYYYRITASNVVGESPPSPVISGIPSSVPGKTAVSIGGIGDSFINISWTGPDDDSGKEIVGYRAYIGPSDIDLTQVEVPVRNWYNFTGLVNGLTYYLGVSALNVLGEGAMSDLVTGVPMSRPSRPLNLKTLAGEGFVHLYWERPEDDGGDPELTYSVFESVDNITFDLLAGGIESNDYNVTPFPSGEFKLYHVRAKNLMGLSQPSNVAFSKSVARPTAPRNFKVATGDSSAVLTWAAPESFGGFDSVTYKVYYGTRPDLLEVFESGITALSIDIYGLSNGFTYYFAISAVNPGGEGPWTDIQYGIPYGTPSKPINLTAEPIDSGMILRWDPPEDFGGSSRISYVVYSGTGTDSQAEIGSTNSTRYTVSYLQNGVTYHFRVRARIGSMNGKISDLASGMPMGLPGPPENVEAIPGDSSIMISWDEPTDDGGSSSLQYRVVITCLSSDSKIIFEDIKNQSFEIAGLINGEEYGLFVLSSNEMGSSIPSIVIRAVPRGPPAPPTSFSVIQKGRNMELRWSPPLSDGGSDLEGYRIYRGTSEDDMRILAEPDPSDISYIDENTLEGVVYHFRITAYNEIGEGEPTSTISVEIPESSDSGSNDTMTAVIVIGSLIILLLVILIFVSYSKRSADDRGESDQMAGSFPVYGQYPADQRSPSMISDVPDISEE